MKLYFCGDTSMIDVNKEIETNDMNTLFTDVVDVLKSGDRVIANVECALTDADTPIKKIGPNLKAPVKCAEILKNAGITDCAISNNHIFDFGPKGIEDTINAFNNNGLNYTGFGKNKEDARKNLIINQDGKSIAIIAVCEHEYCYALEDRMGARAFDAFDTIEDISKAKKENDYVIVLYHGGKEQCVYPSPRLRKICKSMVSNGADVVLCQHSHCIGCYEKFQDGHILYGQGNFHFVWDAIDNPQWENGLIVEIRIDDELKIDFIPVSRQERGITLSKGDEYSRIMNLLKEQSENLNNGKWLDGWKAFCEEKREWYLSVIAKAYVEGEDDFGKELFNHLLRCEAHHDVWEELCPISWEKDSDIQIVYKNQE